MHAKYIVMEIKMLAYWDIGLFGLPLGNIPVLFSVESEDFPNILAEYLATKQGSIIQISLCSINAIMELKITLFLGSCLPQSHILELKHAIEASVNRA